MTLRPHLHCPCCPHYKKPAKVALGPLTVDTSQHAVWWRKQRVANLTATEFRILVLLVGRPGHPLSQREIYDTIKAPGFAAGLGETGFRNNVRSIVRHIRRKFEAVDPEFDNLQTYHGVGYSWVTPAKAASIAEIAR
jgi:two-component system response regulator ChvI